MQTNPKPIGIFGSTGSIGKQALEIAESFPELFTVEVLTAHDNYALLIEQAKKFKPNVVVISEKKHYPLVSRALQNEPVKVYAGEEALIQVMEMDSFGLAVMAIMGFAALKPTVSAMQNKKIIALANKECLVVAGEQLKALAIETQARIVPIDSEHSAIFQCLVGEGNNSIQQISLTASGGPFIDFSNEELATVTPAMALRHPSWRMGDKITIDSATLMNKGLEAIEARWLFDVAPHQIEILIHRQSVVHSLVTFADGSAKAQLSRPDMRLPIQYAMTYPDRMPSMVKPLSLAEAGIMTFERPDVKKFRNLALALQALETGGSLPCVLNAANEVAVTAFLRGEIGFLNIPEIVEETMLRYPPTAKPTMIELNEIDRKARELARQIVKRY
jgi:1-deoxy-D-xylulose-5-phosphate reductoisomerase